MHEITIVRADGTAVPDGEVVDLVGDLCEQAVARLVAECRVLIGRAVARTIAKMRGRADEF
jgi:hypothetical protein